MVHSFIARLQERAEDLFERTLGSYLVESRFKTRMFLLTPYQIQLGLLAHCHLIPLPHVTSENDLTFLQRQGVQGASLLLTLVKEDLFWHVLVDQAQEHISPFHASATDGGQSSRIPVALRLGGVSDPSASISARDTFPPPVLNFNTKTTGKRKVSKTTAPRKRVVARSPLKGVKVRKTNVARSVNPPRKKQ
ncbi:unnamed protein product, partial [Brassica napus]